MMGPIEIERVRGDLARGRTLSLDDAEELLRAYDELRDAAEQLVRGRQNFAAYRLAHTEKKTRKSRSKK